MSPLQVVGLGSPLGQDRIGWEAVRGLAARGVSAGFPPGAVVITCQDRPGSLLVETLAAAPAAVLVDALRCSGPPGAVMRLAPEDLAAGDTVSSHGFGVAQALALARALGSLPPHLVLYGIVISADQALDVSIVNTAVAQLYPQVRADIRLFLGQTSRAGDGGIMRHDSC